MMIFDFEDLESTPDGGGEIITHRMGIETEKDLIFSNCRTVEELRKMQGEERWRLKVRIVDGTIRQRIF